MATGETIKLPRPPYGGLFGDSNLIRVLRQVIADPFTKYRPGDLEMLTKNCAPTVRESLRILTSLGLLTKDERDHQHPVYKVNTESKRYLALTFLAYAVLDDKNGTACLDDVIADYCKSALMDVSYGIGEIYEFSQPLAGVGTGSYFTVSCYKGQSESLLLRLPIQEPSQGKLYTPSIQADVARPVLEEHSKQKITVATA